MAPDNELEAAVDAADWQAILEEIREADAFVVASHENPDGDALGSVRAMQLALRAMGKDVVAFIPHAKVPQEYAFIAPDNLTGEIPSDVEDRILLALDCGNEGRLATPELLSRARCVLNIDHHGDNTRFGTFNVVRGDTACAAQLVWQLIKDLGVQITPPMATALHVGLVTDTGRFQYSNTTLEAFEMAAEMVREGVDVHQVFRNVYEHIEYPRVKLMGRALDRAAAYDGGRIIATHLRREDFEMSGADDDSAEGVVDMLRKVDGACVAVMLRDLPGSAERARKGSLRTSRDDIDVSAIARDFGGGGHRQAAGFSTDDDLTSVVDRVRTLVAAQLGE